MTQPVSQRALIRPARSAPALQPAATPLAEEAAELRREILRALFATGGGHYGGSLSVIDLLLTLYRRQLRVCPEQPRHPLRDRLILSKGHAAIALYAVLRRLAYFSEPLSAYATFGSPLEGHPDMLQLPGVDFSTGSLGQGLSVGLGVALALRTTEPTTEPATQPTGAPATEPTGAPAEHAEQAPRTWVVLGDGECQEGQIWEAAMLAAQQQLGHLHAVIDHNRFQEWGWSPPAGHREPREAQAPAPPVVELAAKWRAFGWRVLEVDGHDLDALERTFAQAASSQPFDPPSVVIAHTVKGKGVPLVEQDPARFHCATVTAAEHQTLLASLPCQ